MARTILPARRRRRGACERALPDEGAVAATAIPDPLCADERGGMVCVPPRDDRGAGRTDDGTAMGPDADDEDDRGSAVARGADGDSGRPADEEGVKLGGVASEALLAEEPDADPLLDRWRPGSEEGMKLGGVPSCAMPVLSARGLPVTTYDSTQIYTAWRVKGASTG